MQGAHEGEADDVVETAAQTLPTPTRVTIKQIQATGDGCRPGKYHAVITPDFSGFEVTFEDYSVRLTPQDVTSAKSCALSIVLGTPTACLTR